MIMNLFNASKDDNLTPENIKSGVEIDGVVGSFTGNIEGNAYGYKDLSGSITCPSTITLPKDWKVLHIYSRYGTGSNERRSYVVVRSIKKYFNVDLTSSVNSYDNNTTFVLSSTSLYTQCVAIIDDNYLQFTTSYSSSTTVTFYAYVIY